jgi:hypothetical protein
MNVNTNLSIYIPRMSTRWTQEGISEVMSKKFIGTVSYVDFTPINKKPGFGEDVDSVVKSAFIHFSEDCHESIMKNEFWRTIESGSSYKLQLEREYWICLKNKNPVQRTLMNIHQVVENGRHLENLIASQSEEIKLMKEIVYKQQKDIEALCMSIYHIIGNLEKIEIGGSNNAKQISRLNQENETRNIKEEKVMMYGEDKLSHVQHCMY